MSSAPSAAPARTEHAKRLFAGLPSTYDRMGTVLSFGQDPRWRRFMVTRLAVPSGGHILDVATGTAAVAILAARRTGGTIVGLDQSEPMLREGRGRVRAAGLETRVQFVIGNGERLPFPDGAFDALTFTYLLRYVEDPADTLAELARVVRAGGTVANLEFHVPSSPVWKALWFVYTRAVMPAAGLLVSRPWYEVGRFLGPSISAFYRRHPLEDQLAMWRESGIDDVRARAMSLGGGVVIWGTRHG